MRRFSRTSQFKKDVKRIEKRGKDLAKLRAVMDLLIDGDALPRVLKIIRCEANSQAVAIVISNLIGFLSTHYWMTKRMCGLTERERIRIYFAEQPFVDGLRFRPIVDFRGK